MPQFRPERLVKMNPAAVVHLRFRFDETMVRVTTDPVPNSVGQPTDKTYPATPHLLPLLDDSLKDGFSHILNIVVTSAKVELTGHRQAPTFSFEFNYRDFPLDPRSIKAMAATVAIGLLPDEDFVEGVLGTTSEAKSRGILYPLDEAGNPRPDLSLVVGNVDEVSVHHSDNGSVVRMSGRGNIGLLLDSPFLTKNIEMIDPDKTIVEVVQQILKLHPQFCQYADNVRAVPSDPSKWPGGKIPTLTDSNVAPIQRKKKRKRKSKVIQVGRKYAAKSEKPSNSAHQPAADEISYWDLITQYCFLVGTIPRMEGYSICIYPANSMYHWASEAGRVPNAPTPFASGAVREVNGQPLYVRQLRYGHNITNLEMTRKFNGVTAHVVECISYCTDAADSNYVLRAWYPEDNDLKKLDTPMISRLGPTGTTKTQDVVRVPVKGITDVKRLKAIAESLFHEIMRGEFTGKIETVVPYSFGGSLDDTDLLRCRPGDCVEVVLDASNMSTFDGQATDGQTPVTTDLARLLAMPRDKAVEAVTDRLNGASNIPEVRDSARRLAEHLISAQRNEIATLPQLFYVNNMNFDFNVTGGITIALDFMNYFEARMDNGPPTEVEDRGIWAGGVNQPPMATSKEQQHAAMLDAMRKSYLRGMG